MPRHLGRISGFFSLHRKPLVFGASLVSVLLFLFFLPGPLFAQKLQTNQNPSSPPDIESCFIYSDYGKVKTNLAMEKQTYHPGETAKIIGTIVNGNKFPLVDIVLYAQVHRINTASSARSYLVDRLTLLENLNFLPGETKWVTPDLVIPATYPDGQYQLEYFILSSNLFNYAGRPYLENDSAGSSSFTIDGGSLANLFIDPATIRVNGDPHSIGEPIVEYDGSSIAIELSLHDEREQKTSVPITVKWYSFEDTSEKLLLKENHQLISPDDQTIRASFAPKTAGAYMVLAEVDSPLRSIVKYRFAMASGVVPGVRISDLGVTNFPPGEKDRAWVCFHASTFDSSPNTTITLSVLNSAKSLIAEKTLTGEFSGSIGAISVPLTKLESSNDFFLKVKVKQSDDVAQSQEMEIHYDCGRFANSQSDLNPQYDAGNQTLMLNGKSGCGEGRGGFAQSVQITQNGKVVKETYNLSSTSFPVSDLKTGTYKANISTGDRKQVVDFTIPGKEPVSSRSKFVRQVIAVGVLLVGGILIVIMYKQWKRKALNVQKPSPH